MSVYASHKFRYLDGSGTSTKASPDAKNATGTATFLEFLLCQFVIFLVPVISTHGMNIKNYNAVL